jgi:hypothetical protein
MGIERKPTWRDLESMEDAARRLLAELDERVRRKASERLECSDKIQETSTRSLVAGDKGREASAKRSAALKLPGQSTAPQGGQGADPVALEICKEGNGLGNECDRVFNRRKLGGGRMAVDHRLGSDRSHIRATVPKDREGKPNAPDVK